MAGKELTLDEMKAVELGILKKFDSICKENGLEYSLAYGTMLGAIRHKGFIPWDDDIDVFMKREDYEKLLKLKYDDGDFEIKSYRYSKNYYFLYSKMVDKRTYICEDWRAEKDMGLFVDIFPLDYCNFSGEGDELKAQMDAESKRIDRKVEIAGILGHKLSHHRSLNPRYIVKFLFKLFTLPFRRLILKKQISCTGRIRAETIWLKTSNVVPSISPTCFQRSLPAALRTVNSRYIRNMTRFSLSFTETI